MPAGRISILYVQSDARWIVRIEGRATTRESLSIERALRDAIDTPDTSIVFDASECDGADSTFLGNLLSLHRRCHRSGSRLVVSRPSPELLAVLRRHRLDQALTVRFDRLPISTSAREIELEHEMPSTTELARHVLESHRNLMTAGGQNAKDFRAIVERIDRAMGEG
jgi:anti-anti-sigma regulatory factor